MNAATALTTAPVVMELQNITPRFSGVVEIKEMLLDVCEGEFRDVLRTAPKGKVSE